MYREDSKLGYVPRMENTAVSRMMDRGARLTPGSSIYGGLGTRWRRIGISIAARITA